jgi:4-amino-4-deoxy-L-arabinose transferase-like glycosyltransferase
MKNRYYLTGLLVVFLIVFTYIFDKKLDLNGDNAEYYVLATSIAGGHGYSDITNEAHHPSNIFPPGYPLLMSAVRIFTDSILPQKVLNGLFLLASSFLFFFFIRKNKLPDALAFVASAVILLNYQVLHFATMMMSEMSFLFFTVLSLWLLSRMDEKNPFWKDPYFYSAIVTVAYAYHIRTQGMALAAAVIGYFLFTKRWKEMLAFGGGFVVCLLPWMLRNKLADVGQSRYVSMIAMSNPWRPEEGTLGMGEVFARFVETFKMLVTKAVPDSILPYASVDYNAATTIGEWGMAILLFALIGVGMWRFGRVGYLFLFYTLATFGIISLFSTPSENRYITPLLPFLEVSLLVGLYTVLSAGMKKTGSTRSFSPWLLLVVVFFSYPKLERLHALNNMPYPPNYRNYFAIATEVHKQLPAKTVVCSRKPMLFYMFGKTAVSSYLWTEDNEALIRGLIDSKTDYVVFEQLGYSSTGRYLYPAIQNNPDLFTPVMHLPDPDTYLLRFEREKAMEKLGVQ